MEFRQAIIEINLDGTYRQFAMDSSRFDRFILNESHHVPLYDIDLDIQFHLDTQHMEIQITTIIAKTQCLYQRRERGSPKYILAATF